MKARVKEKEGRKRRSNGRKKKKEGFPFLPFKIPFTKLEKDTLKNGIWKSERVKHWNTRV